MTADSDARLENLMTTEDEPNYPLDLDGGSVFGRICLGCGFDESVTSFDATWEEIGFSATRSTPILRFPREIWRGWIYCTRCGAFTREQGDGLVDKERTQSFAQAMAYLQGNEHHDETITVTQKFSL